MAARSPALPLIAAVPGPEWGRALVAASPMFGAGAGFLTIAILARVLPFDLLGVYIHWTYAVSILAIVAGMGLAPANAFFAAREPRDVPVINGNTVALAAIAGSLGALALASLIGAEFRRSGLPWLFLAGFATAVPLSTLVSGLGGTLLGQRRNLLFTALGSTQAVVQCAGAVAILLATLPASESFRAALATHVAGFWVALAFAATAIREIGRPAPQAAAGSLGFALPLWVHSIFAVLIQRADILILSLFVPPYEVGVYALASKLGDTLYYLPQGVSLALFADLAQLPPPQAARAAAAAVRLLWCVSALLACLLFAACSSVLPLFIPKIVVSRALLPPLLAGAALAGPNYVLVSCCQALGRPGRVLSITATAFLSKASLLVVLVLQAGIGGAPFAVLGSAVLTLGFGFWQIARSAGVPMAELIRPRAADFEVARGLFLSAFPRYQA